MNTTCGRCPTGQPTPARQHLHATGYGPPADERVCDQHLPDAQRAAARHPNHSVELIQEDRQLDLFDLGGGQ